MEQYVKGFQRFHAGEDVRPVVCLSRLASFYFIIIIIIIIIIIVVVVVVDDDTNYWVYRPPTIYFKFITKCDDYYKVRQYNI